MMVDVLVVGVAPYAGCSSGNTWRAAGQAVRARLASRFGPAVRFDYVDLFSPEMLRHPEIEACVAEGAVPPIVLIDGALQSSGGKLHISAIERAVAERLTVPVGVSRKEPVS